MNQNTPANAFNTITWEQDGSVLFVCLNRPDKHNAINVELMRELRIAFERAGADPTISLIVLGATGGRSFSSGIDLSAGILDHVDEMKAHMINDYLPLVESMSACEKLIIASLEGEAIGLACSLVMHCDLLIMSEEAGLNFVFSDLGLIADGGANWLLPRIIGYSQALQVVLEAEMLTAARCLSLGIANRVLPAQEMTAAVAALAHGLASRAQLPQGLSKQLMAASLSGASLAEVIRMEADAQAECVSSEYFQQAYSRFSDH